MDMNLIAIEATLDDSVDIRKTRSGKTVAKLNIKYKGAFKRQDGSGSGSGEGYGFGYGSGSGYGFGYGSKNK